MKKRSHLRFLCLEDNALDQEIIAETLRADGLDGEFTHARTQDEFLTALKSGGFDVILSDFSLPSYSGTVALTAALEIQPEIPFIFVSGTIGEERAVESLKSGATDYILKDRLPRLAPAVRRALRESQERRARRGAEESLKESEARFRQLAENIQEVFWLTDLTPQKMLYINPAYEKIWGRTCASLYENPGNWLEATHPEDRDRVQEAAMTRQTRGLYDEIYRIVRPDGVVRWVRARAYPIRNEAGEVYRVVGIAEDITERRALEEQFRQSQKMEAIGQLAGGIAHDFNNLLTVIRGNADLALKFGRGLDRDAQECLKQVVAASQRAANLTRQLLAFSRKQVLQPEPLNLNDLVANLVKMLNRLIGEHIQLHCNYGTHQGFVLADAGMLEQVILNLAVNARDAMPDGGRLQLATDRITFDAEQAWAHPEARAGDFACLTVSDSGTGIAAEHLPRIFEPFFTTKGPDQGTGLGLATVYGIVKQHAGWVEVTSRPGAGATFKVFLPAIEARTPDTEIIVAEAPPPGGTETVLLVEDDSPVRLLTRRTLEAFGYRVVEAGSGHEALKIWHADPSNIDLLLTDIMMPGGLTGRELAKQLRSRRPELKVVFMSGYSPDFAGKDGEFNAQDLAYFIQKPYRSAHLLQTVRCCLDYDS